MQHCQENHSAPFEQDPRQVMKGPEVQVGSSPPLLAGDRHKLAALLCALGSLEGASRSGVAMALTEGRQRDFAPAGIGAARFASAAAQNAIIVANTGFMASSQIARADSLHSHDFAKRDNHCR